MNNREPFSTHFSPFDSKARLDEYNRRVKEHFNSNFPMFETPSPFTHHPQWASMRHDFDEPDIEHAPKVEKTIPIKIERSGAESTTNYKPDQQANINNIIDDHNRHFRMSDNSYYQPTSTNDVSESEPRVYHIPIHVESRGENIINSEPIQPLSNNDCVSTSQVNDKTTESVPNVNNKPSRVINVPIQITKSTSTPMAADINKSPTNTECKSYAVNESLSDPVIVKPNQVFVMGYEPIEKTNETVTSSQPVEKDKKETPYDYVKEIYDDLKHFESQVNEFYGTSTKDKGYRFLDEMLTLCVLRLDSIQIDGDDELRKYRKTVINEVNRVTALLEAKVSGKTVSNVNENKSSQEQQQQQGDIPPPQQFSDQHENEKSVAPKSEEVIALPLIPANENVLEQTTIEQQKTSNENKANKKVEKKSKPKKDRKFLIFPKNKKKIEDNDAASGNLNATESQDLDSNNNELKIDTDMDTSMDTNMDTTTSTIGSVNNEIQTLPGKETTV